MVGGLATLTSVQRAENLAKAKAAQREKQAARKASPLRRDFLDAYHWERLAAALGVRMHPWGEPCTASGARAMLKRVGRTPEWYKGETAETTLSEFGRVNPDWPQRAHDGLILEMVARENGIELSPESV